jgi:hypothetical protein
MSLTACDSPQYDAEKINAANPGKTYQSADCQACDYFVALTFFVE